MSTFAYTARDKSGGVVTGSVAALDRGAATASLNAKGLSPILLKEADPTKKVHFLEKFKPGSKVKTSEKVIFSRQFATMINAGVPIVQSLAILKQQSSSKKMQSIIAEVSKKVEGGSTLSGALGEHPETFSPVYINMVRAGETGGILDEVLDRLATQQEKDAEIVSKVKGAMIYPGVVTTVTIGAFIFLMTVIVPKLSVIFEGLGAQLPIYTRIMLSISEVLTSYGIFIAAGMFVIGIAVARLIKKPKGKKAIDTLLLKLPITSNIIRKVNIARFARTFGSLMSSGLAVVDALSTTAQALGNTVFKEELLAAAKEVKNGKPVSQVLKDSTVFPPIVSQMINVGEETGKLDEILLKIAGFYEKEVDVMISSLTSIIEPVLIILLGAMVGSIVVSVFGPISNLSNAIQN